MQNGRGREAVSMCHVAHSNPYRRVPPDLTRPDFCEPFYELHADLAADPRETLEEFLRVTDLDRDAVHWHHPQA